MNNATKTVQIYKIYIRGAPPRQSGTRNTKPEWTVKYGYAPLVRLRTYEPGASSAPIRTRGW